MLRSNSANREIQAQQDVNKSDVTYRNEILCSLDLSENPDAAHYQQAVAGELVEVFAAGAKGVKSNKWKAKKYAKQSGVPSKSAVIPETIWKTATLYNAFGWVNDTRLFAVRVMNILSLAKITLSGVFSAFMNAVGLMYGVRLAFDLGMIAKAVFFPEGEIEKELSKWERFKAILAKDNRMYRIANDVVWLSLNLTALLLSAGASVFGIMAARTLLFFSGLAFDTFAEVAKWSNVRSHQQALTYIQSQKIAVENTVSYKNVFNEITAKKAKLAWAIELQQEDNVLNKEKKAATIQQLENEIKDLEKTPIYREHAKFAHIEAKLTEKLAEVKKDRLRFIGIIAMVCVGMGLSICPLTLPIGLVFLGAGVGLVGGSIITGLGERILTSLRSNGAVKEKAIPEVEKMAEVDVDVIVPNANKLLRKYSSNASVKSTKVLAVAEINEEDDDDFLMDYSPSRNGFYSPKSIIKTNRVEEGRGFALSPN